MSKRVRLLFDECLGRPHIRRIAHLVELEKEELRPEIAHILDLAPSGTLDEVWVPQIAAGEWIVVSGDKGRGGKTKTKGATLPRVLAKHGVTHVLLSAKLHTTRTFEKVISILSVWYELLDLANRPAGSRYSLEPLGPGRAKLIHRPIPAGNRPVPPKGHLFHPSELPTELAGEEQPAPPPDVASSDSGDEAPA